MQKAIVKTDFSLPGQKGKYVGKVRDVYDIDGKYLVMIVSDRISAFDVVLPEGIPYKGQVLNKIAEKFLDATTDILPNWKVAVPDPAVTIGYKCEPFKVEMVIRGYLAGHAWREYKAGKRTLCGITLPEGMVENQKFPEPIVTPTSKAAEGHDEDVSREELIAQGRVKVNGELITSLGYKAFYEDSIEIDGVELKQEKEKVVYLLNKPKNVISSVKDERGRKTVVDFIDSPYRLFPLGRLDYDSSGLILLSNDGQLMQKLIHPKYEVEKVYEVSIDNQISDKEIEKLENGVKIDDYVSAPLKIERCFQKQKASFLKVTIHEGKNREIRKLFETLGYHVTRLHRIEEAGIGLGNLKSGEYRRLKPYEVKKLKAYLDRKDL